MTNSKCEVGRKGSYTLSWIDRGARTEGCTYDWDAIMDASAGKWRLVMPKNSVKGGCLFDVEFVAQSDITDYAARAIVTIEAQQLDPIAKIRGAWQKNHQSHQDLELDGGKSYDPEGQSFTYTWTCEFCFDVDGNDLLVGLDTASSTLVIPNDKLLGDTTYTFTLTITCEDGRSASVTKSRTIIVTEAPSVNIWFDTDYANPAEKNTFYGSAYHSNGRKVTSNKRYYWWMKDTTLNNWFITKNYKKQITINNENLEPGNIYTIVLDVTTSAGTGRDEFEFQLNEPPVQGTFVVSPTSGNVTSDF